MKQFVLPGRKFNLGLILCLACVLALLMLASSALAEVQALSLPWWTVDSGGGESRGGNFVLNGAIGQSDAGNMSGGSYKLSGGFLAGPVSPPPMSFKVFLPLTMRR